MVVRVGAYVCRLINLFSISPCPASKGFCVTRVVSGGLFGSGQWLVSLEWEGTSRQSLRLGVVFVFGSGD
jgi:hypothetical protein